MVKWLLIWLLLITILCPKSSLANTNLVEAILSTDVDRQLVLIRALSESYDLQVQEVLTAWRGGVVYIFETNNEQIPIYLEAVTDTEGKSQARKVLDGTILKDEKGGVLMLAVGELTAADASSKLRKAIKTTLDIFALGNPDPKMRRDAVVKLGQQQNLEYIPYFTNRLSRESSKEVKKALIEAVALTKVAATNENTRVSAIAELAEMRSINSLNFLQALVEEAKKTPGKYGTNTLGKARLAITQIETYMWWGNLFGTAFRGLSLAGVLLVAALGLTITFGLMGVINMAHGEVIMVGAYTAYLTQNIFQKWAQTTPSLFNYYFIPSLVFSFLTAALVGLILERCIIRFLYRRPLESLLATWGVSLVLQQLFRTVFGAANVQVSSPNWLSGSFVISDVLLAYNRVFVIGFAVFTVGLTYWLLTYTSLGLQIRAVMQNRSMASALGVRTDRINMLTFAFGSGLAGMAGACLSQIGNVGPSLGQNYIVDCFMIVVLGGVGHIVGTVSASLGVGVTDQILQPWLGAVLGKIAVLAAIILFLQWRPAGLFATRGRNLEG